MDWKSFWNEQAKVNANPQAQVGRIKSGMTLPTQVLEDIVLHIVNQLDLQASDRLLDLCCGNGLLTAQLAKHCKEVVGVDIASEQIAQAKEYFALPTISYFTGDVIQGGYLPENQLFSKINLYFSFQYIERFELGKKAIQQMLPYLASGGKIFIGDVPYRKYLGRYYRQPQDQIRYFVKQFMGTNDMGKFWSGGEMHRIAKSLDLKLEVLEQPAHLPYAAYRKDFLFEKK